MSRAYNDRVSARVNESLNRREEVVRNQKRVIGIGLILFISLGIILGTSIISFADSKNKIPEQNKYYTSIQIKPGDTLWDIAKEYTFGTDVTVEEYIDEICRINEINQDQICSGDYIVVSYYSAEEK